MNVLSFLSTFYSIKNTFYCLILLSTSTMFLFTFSHFVIFLNTACISQLYCLPNSSTVHLYLKGKTYCKVHFHEQTCQMGEFHEKVIKLGHFFVGLPRCYVYRLFIWGLKGCKICHFKTRL